MEASVNAPVGKKFLCVARSELRYERDRVDHADV